MQKVRWTTTAWGFFSFLNKCRQMGSLKLICVAVQQWTNPFTAVQSFLLTNPQYLQKMKIKGIQNLPSGIYLLPLSSPTKVTLEVNQENTGFCYKPSISTCLTQQWPSTLFSSSWINSSHSVVGRLYWHVVGLHWFGKLKALLIQLTKSSGGHSSQICVFSNGKNVKKHSKEGFVYL